MWFSLVSKLNNQIKEKSLKALVKVTVVLWDFFLQQGRTPHIVCRSKEMRTLLAMNSSAAANVSMG